MASLQSTRMMENDSVENFLAAGWLPGSSSSFVRVWEMKRQITIFLVMTTRTQRIIKNKNEAKKNSFSHVNIFIVLRSFFLFSLFSDSFLGDHKNGQFFSFFCRQFLLSSVTHFSLNCHFALRQLKHVSFLLL